MSQPGESDREVFSHSMNTIAQFQSAVVVGCRLPVGGPAPSRLVPAACPGACRLRATLLCYACGVPLGTAARRSSSVLPAQANGACSQRTCCKTMPTQRPRQMRGSISPFGGGSFLRRAIILLGALPDTCAITGTD